MNLATLILGGLALVLAFAAFWGWTTARRERRRAETAEARANALGVDLARLDERARNVDEASARVAETFKAASAEAAAGAADALLKRAEEAFRSRDLLAQERLSNQLQPVADTLQRFEAQVGALEKARAEDTGGLKASIEAMLQASNATQEGARKLVDALTRSPTVRGRWGEQTLRNVLEDAGLAGRFDFLEQLTVQGENGALRPDAAVRLAGGGVLVVDAKVNLNAYLEAHEATDEALRHARLARHGQAMREHVHQLSRKSYWDQFKKPPFERSPSFVVMFVPGENFLCAALDQQPRLMEEARELKVLIATPMTLFALLQAVAAGWRAEDQAANAQAVAETGRELYARLSVMTGHVEDVGAHLAKAVGKYNQFVGSLKDRVLPQARRFETLAAHHEGKTLADPEPVEAMPRLLSGAVQTEPSRSAVQ